MSYPSRVRGLKHKMIELLTDTIISYPSWVRGLKPREKRSEKIVPFMGTGIKARRKQGKEVNRNIVPFMGTGIKAYISLSVPDMG